MSDPHFILLDASYFMFFRYHALKRWWSHSKREGEPENPLDCERYMKTFHNTFANKLAGLRKLAGYGKKDSPIVITAHDCPSSKGWRRVIWPEYKATRVSDTLAHAHFDIVKKENLFKIEGVGASLEYPGLEGDDCIALTVEEILKNHKGSKITIISSDADFKQLLGPDVRLVDLKGKCHGGWDTDIDAEKELFCKILSGDKSDNIPSVLPKCGPKTAESLYQSPEQFESRIALDPLSAGLYARNRLLVDFRCIPKPLADGFRRDRLRILR